MYVLFNCLLIDWENEAQRGTRTSVRLQTDEVEEAELEPMSSEPSPPPTPCVLHYAVLSPPFFPIESVECWALILALTPSVCAALGMLPPLFSSVLWRVTGLKCF